MPGEVSHRKVYNLSRKAIATYSNSTLGSRVEDVGEKDSRVPVNGEGLHRVLEWLDSCLTVIGLAALIVARLADISRRCHSARCNTNQMQSFKGKEAAIHTMFNG